MRITSLIITIRSLFNLLNFCLAQPPKPNGFANNSLTSSTSLFVSFITFVVAISYVTTPALCEPLSNLQLEAIQCINTCLVNVPSIFYEYPINLTLTNGTTISANIDMLGVFSNAEQFLTTQQSIDHLRNIVVNGTFDLGGVPDKSGGGLPIQVLAFILTFGTLGAYAVLHKAAPYILSSYAKFNWLIWKTLEYTNCVGQDHLFTTGPLANIYGILFVLVVLDTVIRFVSTIFTDMKSEVKNVVIGAIGGVLTSGLMVTQ